MALSLLGRWPLLSDAQYAAIGRVAVAASELEHLVVMMLVLRRGNKGDANAMAAQNNSQWRRELLRLTRDDSTEHGNATALWLENVEQLLDRRHALMHARWFRDGSSAIRSPIGMRARRDKGSEVGRLTPVVVDLPAWSNLADALDEAGRQVWPLVREEMHRCGLT